MPTGNTPSASVPLLSFNVTVSWSASTFSGGGSVSGYVVKRYPAAGGAAVTPAAGCSGTVAGTSCTENGVPVGSWKYSVTPVRGGWTGTESAQSAAVGVPGGT
jgi:hypothetical protein